MCAASLKLTECPTDASVCYYNFSSVQSLSFVKSATTVEDRLRLAVDDVAHVGAVWHSQKQYGRSGFTTEFEFQIITPLGIGADGFASVLQNHAIGALGASGGGLGYGGTVKHPEYGIPRSIAVEFDTYTNVGRNDPNDNHMAIISMGTLSNHADHHYSYSTTTDIPTLSNGNRYTVRVAYKNHRIGIFFDDFHTPVREADIDVDKLLDLRGEPLWVGVTGATGTFTQYNDILGWYFVGSRASLKSFVRKKREKGSSALAFLL